MKKFTSLLIGCSLALAGAAMAQQPEEQPSPTPKHAAEKGKGHAAEAKPAAAEAKPEANAPKPEGNAAEQHKAKHAPAAAKAEKAEPTNAPAAPEAAKPQATPAKQHGTKKAEKTQATPQPAASPGNAAEVSGSPAASATPGPKKHADKKGMKAPAAAAKTSPSATPTTAATATPAAAASAAPSVAPISQPKAQTGAAAAKKPAPEQVQQIKAEHATFRAQPKPDQVPTVTFNQEYRIQGADQWQGQQYEVYRSYHPERHDEGFYRSHYSRVELIGGGYYYLHNGYWYPAWGYNRSSEYYAYDGPIYVGHRAEPLDRVIADVQSALQQMGYYKGEVDGLLGPLTRHALTAYQSEQGLTATAVIDEPTLDALGMG
jgi:hypothetical protein